jgi:hypothetical protein
VCFNFSICFFQATAVLVMMTEVDREESEASGGSTANSATIRTILALRTIIYSNGSNPALTFNPLLRVVVHLESPCKFLNAASFVAPASNRSVLHAQDLSRNINSLMFYCASKPGRSVCLYCRYFRCRSPPLALPHIPATYTTQPPVVVRPLFFPRLLFNESS